MAPVPFGEGPHTWDYRVMGFTAFTSVPGVEPQEAFVIIEAYYDEHGQIVAWGDNVGALGDTPEDLRKDLAMMLEACDKPILNREDLPGSRDASA